MPETRNRKIARRCSRVVKNDTIDANGNLDAQFVTHYSNISSLPGSGTEGDLAYVSAGGRKYLYIYITHDGDPYTATGWYSVALGAAA